MLGIVQLVLRKRRDARAVQKAAMRQRAMIGSGKGELPHTMLLRFGVYPEEQIFSRAEADCKLVLRWASKSRVDDINIAGDHRTP